MRLRALADDVGQREELPPEDLQPDDSPGEREYEAFAEDDLQTTPYNSDYPPPDLQNHRRSWPIIPAAPLNYSSWPPTVLDARTTVVDFSDRLAALARELFARARLGFTRGAGQARAYLQSGATSLAETWDGVDERKKGLLRLDLLRGRAPYVAGLILVALAMFSIGRTVRSGAEAANDVKGAAAPTPEASPMHGSMGPAAVGGPAHQEEIRLPAVPGVSPSPDKEAPILLALAENLIAARRDAEAVPVLERALARNPKLTDDPAFLRVVKRAALSEDRMAAAQTYALLVGPMGERGAEILYEISVSPASRRGVRERAAYYVYTKDFERKAPLPLYAAFKLVSAPTCEAKKSLLPFAAEAGGRHALAYLRELDERKICTLEDLDNCYSCMNVDEELPRTITEIETRLGSAR